MSLDIYLKRSRYVSYDKGVTYEEDNETVYDCNITHNLTRLADEASIYEALWRPFNLHPDYHKEDYEDEFGRTDYDAEWEFECSHTMYAKDVINILEKGLNELKDKPDYYKQFESDNGWGLYIQFVPFVEKYLNACKEFPDAIIECSR